MPRIGCHLLLVLLFSLSANAQQQFSALGGFPQHPSFQPFQHSFGVIQPFGQPAQFGVQPVQPVQPVQTFQQPSFPVQPQLNPLFPFTLPTFTFAPPVNPFIPFGQATQAPVYTTNQVQPQQPAQQGVQQPGQPQLPQQQQLPQGVQPQQPVVQQPQQPAVQQQIQPVAPPQPQPIIEAPTTLVAVQETTTTAPTTTEEALPVVDSRIEPKKPRKNSIKIVKKEDSEEQPPETPKELTGMRDNDEESEENDYENISKEQPTAVNHRSRIQAAGSATQPRVLDFRSINNVKTTTSQPLSVLRASAKEAKEAEQREVDEILNRVLDAVMPMHRQMEAAEQMEETEF